MVKPIRDARGKRPQFYDVPGMDQAMSMILVLAGEVSVLADRLDTLARVASAQGVDLAEAVEDYAPPQSVLEARELRRQDFLERLYYCARKDAADVARADTHAHYHETLADIAKG